MKTKTFLAIIVFAGIIMFPPFIVYGHKQESETDKASSEKKTPEMEFKNEPAARALYEKMIETMRAAESLSYTSEFQWEARGEVLSNCTYTIWLKKPNYFRVETLSSKGDKGGTLVGDGNDLWIFWSGERPFFSSEDRESFEKTASNVYMKEPTPLARHSIGHKTGLLGAGMSSPVFDPSTFHGYTDSLQRYIDGVRSLGTEKVGNQECDVIEVSIMKGQRIWQFWLSRRDYLPRKLKEIVHVSYDIITTEQWSQVTINSEIPPDKFVWTPPEGWQQWRLPSAEERLLKPGQDAPDFELLAADGTKIKLSGYRGKVIWFYIWRAG
ncbi:MAG: DUF2092 domain-containing protein [Sedimentisphaerales bacterium]|nr:DUF2092 domain-containing protein [Sedimentisphaerales bacterium]